MTTVRISLAVALLPGIRTLPVQAQTLGIGDPAPKLAVKSFVKGEPVSEFEPGKNYVVEFWATWCGPCKTSIPHLTELQKKNPSVTFIGVSICGARSGQSQTVRRGDGRQDGLPRGHRLWFPKKRKTTEAPWPKHWMTAAGQEGIPAAFIVNKEGKIAWIGHPMEMDKPLEKIVAGTWDMKEAREEQRKAAKMQAQAGEGSVQTRHRTPVGRSQETGGRD